MSSGAQYPAAVAAVRRPAMALSTPRVDEVRRTSRGGGDEEEASSAKVVEAAARRNAAVLSIILLSIASSVCLILVNKAVMKTYRFGFVFSLTTAHFLCMWGALEGCARAGVFAAAAIPAAAGRHAGWLVGAMGVGSIAFMNFSLNANTVGTYQMLKLLVIPAVLAIEYAGAGKVQPRPVVASLAVLLGGVGFATVTDVELSAWGMLWGAFAVMATAQFNIWQGSKQKEWGLSSTQLTHALAPYMAAVTGVAAVFFDCTGPSNIFEHKFVSTEVFLIGFSCAVATSVNLCSMGLIGRTSAVTCVRDAHMDFPCGPPFDICHR